MASSEYREEEKREADSRGRQEEQSQTDDKKEKDAVGAVL